MKKLKKITCLSLILAMILTMGIAPVSAASAEDNNGIYVALGDSVSAGDTDGCVGYPFSRTNGSFTDIAADLLNMGLVPLHLQGTRTCDIRSFLDSSYYPEYAYYRIERTYAAEAAYNGMTYNELGEYYRNWISRADLISITVGSTDLLYAPIMEALWYLEDKLGIESERSKYEASILDRDIIYDGISMFPADPWTVLTEPVYEGMEPMYISTWLSSCIDDYTPENFDLEQWFSVVESRYFSSEDFDAEDSISILLSLCEIARDKNFLSDFLSYLADSVAGRAIQYEVDYRAVIDDIYALNPDVTIILVSETCPFDGITGYYGDIPCEDLKSIFHLAFEEANQDLIRMANEKNCLYVDGSDCELSINYDLHTMASYLFTDDFAFTEMCGKMHPNAADYQKIAERFASVYNSYLAGTYENPVSTGIGNDICTAVKEIKNIFGVDLFQFDIADFRIDFDALFSGLDSFFDQLFTFDLNISM